MRGMKQNKKRSTRCVKIKYVGVQSWKAAHLSTLEIRVEQNRNRVKKREKWEKKINAASTGLRKSRNLRISEEPKEL